ncbi:MAG: hypothetical protein OEZ13_06835 [Spirochaetia bacterium]|nr:hypothetical protein [Spirochaetia bacterium]
MKNKILYSLIIIYAFTSLENIFGYHFKWEKKASEPEFEIDIPSNWQYTYITKRNGTVVTITDGIAVIEVRSVQLDKALTQKELINLKAARMSARFSYIRLLYQRKAANHRERYIAAWKVVHKNKQYTEKTAFVLLEDKLLALSCLVLSKDFSNYRVIFDNAAYSLDFSEQKPVPEPVAEETQEPEEIKIPPEDKLYFTEDYLYFNRPNSMYQVLNPKNGNRTVKTGYEITEEKPPEPPKPVVPEPTFVQPIQLPEAAPIQLPFDEEPTVSPAKPQVSQPQPEMPSFEPASEPSFEPVEPIEEDTLAPMH